MTNITSTQQRDREEFRFFSGLYPHQIEGIAFLTSKGRAILADDMGLGKIRQAIVAMQQAAPEGAILIICPASLKRNWRREIRAVDAVAKSVILPPAARHRPSSAVACGLRQNFLR